MTNNLEKQFFEAFGIEPKPLFSTRNGYTDDKYIYPTITDRHYLELLDILLNFEYIGLKKGKDHYSVDFQGWLEQRESSLKNAILKSLCFVANSEFKDIVHKDVQALFEEG